MAGLGAVDGAGEAHAHVDPHACAFHDAIQGGFVIGKGEVGQEAQRAQRKTKDGRHDALEEPGRVEDGAIAAKGEDEIESFG